MKVYKFKVDNYEFIMEVDKDNISIQVATPESFPFPADILYFKNDNGSSPVKDRNNWTMEEFVGDLAKEGDIAKDPNKDLWWQEYKLNHKQQYLDEITTALNKTFNSKFKIIEEQ